MLWTSTRLVSFLVFLLLLFLFFSSPFLHYLHAKDDHKNRRMFELIDAVDFNQVGFFSCVSSLLLSSSFSSFIFFFSFFFFFFFSSFFLHYLWVKDDQKNRRLFELVDALDFSQVGSLSGGFFSSFFFFFIFSSSLFSFFFFSFFFALSVGEG